MLWRMAIISPDEWFRSSYGVTDGKGIKVGNFDCVNISNGIGWWYITFDTTIVFQWWSNALSIFPMGYPIFCVVDFEWMSNLVPGVTSGVIFKSKISWRYAKDDSLGFNIELCKRFGLMTNCGMRRSHSDTGTLVLVLSKPD